MELLFYPTLFCVRVAEFCVMYDEISTLSWSILSGILQVTTDGRILGEALSSQVPIHTIPAMHITNQCHFRLYVTFFCAAFCECYVARFNVESYCDILVSCKMMWRETRFLV